MATIGVVPTLTFNGNSPTEKAIGSVAEVQIKRILRSTLANQFVYRASASAMSINELPGLAVALYRLPQRNVWGVNYDLNTGAEKQTGGLATAQVNIDKTLNMKFTIETFSIEAFLKASPDIATAMVGEWIGSLTINLMENHELIFRRAVQDYCIARYGIDNNSVFVFDPATITDEASAKAFFKKFNNHLLNYMDLTNEYQVGTNKSDWVVAMDRRLKANLTEAFTGFIDNVGAQSLVSGEWYDNSIFGTRFSEDFWLNKTFTKTDKNRMNRDCTFNLSGTSIEAAHLDAVAMPITFTAIVQTLDPFTGNILWIGKCIFALPAILRPLVFIARPTAPTTEEITAAQARMRLSSLGGDGKNFDLETHSTQIVAYDDLVDVLTSSGGGSQFSVNDDELKAAQKRIADLEKQVSEASKTSKEK